MLVGYPQHGFFGKVIDDAVYRTAVAVVVVPAAAADFAENGHRGRLVLHNAVGGGETFVDTVISVQPRLFRIVLVIAGLKDKVGHPLIIRLRLRFADRRVVIVVGDDEPARGAVVVRRVRAVHPFENRAFARGIGHHIVIGGLGGIVQVVCRNKFHGLLHAVRIIEDQAEHGGGGEVGFIRFLVGGDGGFALISHVDPAADARVVHAVEGRVGRGEAGNFIHQSFDVLIRVHADKLQIDRRNGGVPSLARVGKDERGIRLCKIVIPRKQFIPVFCRRRKGRAGDFRFVDREVDQSFRDVSGDKIDQRGIVFRAALFEKFIEIKAAFHLHAIDGTVEMLVVARKYLFEGGDARKLVAPHAAHGDAQNGGEGNDNGEYDNQYPLPKLQFSFCLDRLHIILLKMK